MEKVVKDVIDILKNSFYINIPEYLQVKVQDLYHLGKIKESDDYEKIIASFFTSHNSFFENEEIKIILTNIFEKNQSKEVDILFLSSDLGTDLVSFIISCEIILKNLKNEKKINYYTIYPSFSIVEKIRNMKIDELQLLKAGKDELKYFIDMVDYYTVRRDILNKINFIVSNVFSNPLRSEIFDIIIVNNFSKIYIKEKVFDLSREIYKLLKSKGFFIPDVKEADLFSTSLFEHLKLNEFNYFNKPLSDEFMISDYTFNDALNFFRNKQYNEALGILQSILSKNGFEDLQIYKLILIIYTRLRDDMKIEYLEKQLNLNNITDPDFDFIIGAYYFNNFNYSIAKLYFQKSLQKKNNFIYSLYYLALIEKLTGRKKASLELFKKIIEFLDYDNYYIPALYPDEISKDMIRYISLNEIEGEE